MQPVQQVHYVLVYANCWSVKSKLTDLKLVSSALPDNTIFRLMETWLDSSVCDAELSGWSLLTIYRRDCRSQGGGMLITLPSNLPAIGQPDLEHQELEAIFLKLCHPKGSSFLVCACCPPSTCAAALRSSMNPT